MMPHCIDCHREAVESVGWVTEGPYNMCEICAHHSIKNRNAASFGKLRNAKHAHFIAEHIRREPPIPCEIKLLDDVIYTNDYGVEFEMKVVGFHKHADDGRFVYLDKESYWYPISPEQLRKV